MTKILHVSDTHIDKWQYKNDTRRQDFIDAFDQSIDIAIDEDVDAVMHTGDLFEDPNPHSTSIKQVFDSIRKLSGPDIPFYAIVGNHERKRDTQWMDIIESIDIAERLDTTPTMVGDDDVALYGIDAIRRTEWETTDFTLTPPESDDAFTLVGMHELLHPPVPEHIYQRSPRVYHATDVLDRFDVAVDALALGDYHERVDAEVNGTTLFYPGSTEKCAADEGDVRSVDILHFDNGNFRRERHALDTRPFKTVPVTILTEGGISDVESELEKRDIDDCVVTIELSGEEAPFSTQQVRKTARRHGALVALVDDTRDSAGPDIPEVEQTDYNVADIESVVDDAITDIGLTETAVNIEQAVRNTDGVTTDTGVRSRADDIVAEHAPDGPGGSGDDEDDATDAVNAAEGDAE